MGVVPRPSLPKLCPELAVPFAEIHKPVEIGHHHCLRDTRIKRQPDIDGRPRHCRNILRRCSASRFKRTSRAPWRTASASRPAIIAGSMPVIENAEKRPPKPGG